MQVSQAGKRLAPGDPDKSLPRAPRLEPWDLFRYLWRGKLRLKATDVDVALGVTAEPDLTASTPRLQVQLQMMPPIAPLTLPTNSAYCSGRGRFGLTMSLMF